MQFVNQKQKFRSKRIAAETGKRWSSGTRKTEEERKRGRVRHLAATTDTTGGQLHQMKLLSAQPLSVPWGGHYVHSF